MKGIMQATVPSESDVLEARARLMEMPSAARRLSSVKTVWQPKANSFTLLVCHVHPSQRWENAVWIVLGAASLVLVVMSFHR